MSNENGANAATTPADVIHHIFLFTPPLEIQLYSSVCQSWNLATLEPGLWNALCTRYGWPNNGRAWFLMKLRILKSFDTVVPSQFPYPGGGVGAIHVPVPHKVFSWGKKKVLNINANTVVTALTAPSNALVVWDVAARKFSKIKALGKIAPSCSAICDRLVFFADSKDAKLYIADLATNTLHEFNSSHHSSVTCICLDPESMIGATGSYDTTVRVWDLNSRRQICILSGHDVNLWSVDVNRHDPHIIASGDTSGVVRVWNIQKGGSCLMVLRGHTDTVMAVKFDPSRPLERLYTAGYDKEIKVWNIKYKSKTYMTEEKEEQEQAEDEKRCLRTYTGHTKIVLCLLISDYFIISGSRDNTIRITDKHTGELVRELKGHTSDIKCLHFFPSTNGHDIVSGSYDESFILWKFTDIK